MTIRHHTPLTLALTLALCLWAGVGWGATVYTKVIDGTVYYESGATSCDDVTDADTSGDLQAAIDAAGTDGTCYVCEGTYSGTDIDAADGIDITNGGVSIIGIGAAVIDGDTYNDNLIESLSVDGVTIQDLTLDNAEYTAIFLQGNNHIVDGVIIGSPVRNGVQWSEGSGLTVKNSIITNPGNSGVAIMGSTTESASDSLIDNNTISGAVTNDGIVIHVGDADAPAGSNHVVSNNMVSGNAENSIDINTGTNVSVIGNNVSGDGEASILVGSGSSSVTLEKNEIHDTSNGMSISQSCTIKNNLFYGTNTADAINVVSGGTVQIFNNTIYWGADNIIDIDDITTKLEIKNNIWFTGSDRNAVRNLSTTSFTSSVYDFSNNRGYSTNADTRHWYNSPDATLYNLSDMQTTFGLETDTTLGSLLLNDSSNYDFTLQPASPCIDTGTDLGDDYDIGYAGLDQDEHGNGWEIGAYVYDFPATGRRGWSNQFRGFSSTWTGSW